MATTLAYDSELLDYSDAFLTCRGLNHPWIVAALYRDGTEIHRILRCPRCDTERVDRWTRNGERAGNPRYVYEPGYRIEGGVQREDVRLAVMSRSTIFESYDDALQAYEQSRGRARNTR